MTDRLFLERECEHGEMSEHIWFTPKRRAARSCPGGERRELTVDYGAATLQLGAIAKLTDAPSDWLRAEARAIVDAALGLTEEGTQQ